MLRTILFGGFAILVIVFGIVSAFIGISIIQDRVIQEAQTRVRSDLSSAWNVTLSEEQRIGTILKLAATIPIVISASADGNWPNQEVQNRLELLRMDFGLDFLTIISAKGEAVVRGAPPYNTGDFHLSNAAILKALRGEAVTSIEILSKENLELELQGLAERAFIPLEETPHARPSLQTEETRGMVLMGAVPIEKGRDVVGVMYGGILLNRNHTMVDRIMEITFKDEAKSLATGTMTIFLFDSRIATAVRLANGNRAIGTRASKEVADYVLENGQRWEGRAFVVNDWYLSAYDPIRDHQNRVIGMLYVGILEKPFKDLIRDTLLRYALLSVVGLAIALVLAFFLAERVAGPLHHLAQAAQKMHLGERPEPVSATHTSSQEMKTLIETFNEMVDTISERTANLQDANEQMEKANDSLVSLNRSYMETLGFISHELKSPLATIMNYVYLLQEQKVGTLTERQGKAVRNIDNNVKLIVEMVRHYLNLSRIENGELQPVVTRIELAREIVTPLLESFEVAAKAHAMSVHNEISIEIVLQADLNMTREVFENLISNAIKYGREGGQLKLTAQPDGDFIRFGVFNEGEGVTPEKINTMFQKFSRLEEHKATRKQKGTGLGLFICKYIVESHGGNIRVESRPGEWIEFIFTLPRYHGKEEQPGNAL
jgi:two-component system, NtrC family, sensor kinase